MKKLLFALVCTAVFTTACGEKTADEKIKDGLEEAAEGAQEKSEEAGEKAKDLFNKAKDKVQEAAE